MKKYMSAILSLILLLSLAGCGDGSSSVEDTADDISETEIIESETEEKADDTVSTDIVYDVNNLSQEQRNMIYILDLVSYTEVPEDIDDVWTAVFGMLCDTWYDEFLVDELGIAFMDGPGLTVPESFILELFSALWVDFDGTLPPYPTDFPENTIMAESSKNGDLYTFYQGDRGEGGMYTLIITSWIEHADGSITVEARQVWDQYVSYLDSGKIYRYELTENEYTKPFENPLFAYTVTGFEVFDGFILADSDSRYYTESELDELSREDLRYARNEIYARHGYIFESEDLRSYFESKSWYEGTVSSDDFDDGVFNEYEKANIDAIKAVEQGSFSFSELDNSTFWFSSGHGAWQTYLTVFSDGTFEGSYNDWDAAGSDLEGNDINNINYHCDFSGKFSEPQRIDKYTYSAEIEYLNYEHVVNTEEYIDDALYIYTDAYGVGAGDEVLIYLPGMPLSDLPDAVISWNMDLYLNEYYERDSYSAQVSRSELTEDMILQIYVIWDTEETNGGVFWQ